MKASVRFQAARNTSRQIIRSALLNLLVTVDGRSQRRVRAHCENLPSLRNGRRFDLRPFAFWGDLVRTGCKYRDNLSPAAAGQTVLTEALVGVGTRGFNHLQLVFVMHSIWSS